jgi:multiple sugar transport system permease protein
VNAAAHRRQTGEAAPGRRLRRPKAARARSEGAREERRLGWLLCAPAVVVMLAVTAYPIAYAVDLSLQRYDLRFPDLAEYVGFSNYGAVLSSSFWWEAFLVTVVVTAASVAVELVLGMGLAVVMHRALFGRGAVRTAVLVPYGIVTVVAAFSWQYAWTPGTGYLASLLPEGSAPLTERWDAIGLIILAEIWKTTPFMALLLLAGLALVPEETLRAASVDGATAWQRFVHVTIPLMKPAILVALLFRTLDAFRVFDNIYILTAGANSTESVSILGYDNLFTSLNLGIGSAISVLIFLCVALIAFAFVKLFGTAAPGAEGGR